MRNARNVITGFRALIKTEMDLKDNKIWLTFSFLFIFYRVYHKMRKISLGYKKTSQLTPSMFNYVNNVFMYRKPCGPIEFRQRHQPNPAL